MKPILSIFICLLLLSGFSCKNNSKKDSPIDSAWVKLTLPNQWTIYAPPGFSCKTGRGVDSDPGWIISKRDSIALEFDSGSHEYGHNNCALSYQYQQAKASIDTGFYKTFYKVPQTHRANIDTIDDKIAVIVKPNATAKGTTGIEILGCAHQPWIAITGKNLSAKKEKLVLEMYKTVRQSDSNK
jgi:hypothetical protein